MLDGAGEVYMSRGDYDYVIVLRNAIVGQSVLILYDQCLSLGQGVTYQGVNRGFMVSSETIHPHFT